MFTFLIIVGFLILLFKSLQHLPSIQNQVQQAIEFHSSRVQCPAERSNEIMLALDTNWLLWDPDTSDPSLSTSCIRQLGRQSKYYGPIEMQIESDHIQIFDWHFFLPYGNTTLDYFQTVVIIKPEELRLPPFFLKPRSQLMFHHHSIVSKVKTETPLDLTYEVESMTPFRLKSLFQSEVGRDELIPFLVGQDWTVQWTGDRLIVYKLNQLVPPQQIQHFALEVTDFFHPLKSAPDDVERHMNEFIDQAIEATV